MLKIRLQRIGRRNNPSYRVVVVEAAAAAKKGMPVELLGTHDTIRKTTTLKKERILYWMSKGAQVSNTMHNILVTNGIIQGVKKNVLPKKSPVKAEEEATKETTEEKKEESVTEEKPEPEEKKEEQQETPTKEFPSNEG